MNGCMRVICMYDVSMYAWICDEFCKTSFVSTCACSEVDGARGELKTAGLCANVGWSGQIIHYYIIIHYYFISSPWGPQVPKD